MFYLIMLIFLGVVGFDVYRMMIFIKQGPRFTAQDGQELCERVKILEERNYGYRDAGKKPLDCRYGR